MILRSLPPPDPPTASPQQPHAGPTALFVRWLEGKLACRRWREREVSAPEGTAGTPSPRPPREQDAIAIGKSPR